MTSPAIDPETIASLRALNQPGEPDVVREVMTMFLADAPGRIHAIAAAASRQDALALQRAAHEFKGATGNIGATGLQRCARELEAAARRAEFDTAPALVAELHTEFTRVQAEIARLLES